ncbi:MAG: CRISPR-associated endoribonuclease Cas6 [candidate division WOR-3 bacterium]|nr:CRISPR-associated endoribonuclease Cas6 [candidate division WOR-3 bacterium]
MRFSCKIFLKKETLMPKDYRRYLISLVKEAIKKSGSDGEQFYNKYYSSNIPKPFTFSAYFPSKSDNSKNMIGENYFNFYFSSNNYEFLMRVYNGLNYIKNEKFILFNTEIEDIKNFNLLPEKRFDKNEITFKTLSPFLVRSIKNGDNYVYPSNLNIKLNKGEDKKKEFKYWEEVSLEDFKNNLLNSINSLILKEIPEIKEKVESIEISDQSIVVPISHGSSNINHKYFMTFPGIKGQLKIKANPEILKLFYDLGIGARRSEGFGMLEVI